jgi:hypothetical protein
VTTIVDSLFDENDEPARDSSVTLGVVEQDTVDRVRDLLPITSATMSVVVRPLKCWTFVVRQF